MPDEKSKLEAHIINHQLTNELRHAKNTIMSENFHGSTRSNKIQDTMVLTRKIGHPELIFNEAVHCHQEFNTANSEGRWSCASHDEG